MHVKSQSKIITYEITTSELLAHAAVMEELAVEWLQRLLTYQQDKNRKKDAEACLQTRYFQREVLAHFLGIENVDIDSYTPDYGTGKWEVVVKTTDD